MTQVTGDPFMKVRGRQFSQVFCCSELGISKAWFRLSTPMGECRPPDVAENRCGEIGGQRGKGARFDL